MKIIPHHLKYKKIDLAPCNKSIMANDLLSTNLERFYDGLTLRLHVNSAKLSRVICPKLAKMAIFKPP